MTCFSPLNTLECPHPCHQLKNLSVSAVRRHAASTTHHTITPHHQLLGHAPPQIESSISSIFGTSAIAMDTMHLGHKPAMKQLVSPGQHGIECPLHPTLSQAPHCGLQVSHRHAHCMDANCMCCRLSGQPQILKHCNPCIVPCKSPLVLYFTLPCALMQAEMAWGPSWAF